MSEDTNTAPTKAEAGGSVTDLGEGGYRGPNPPAGFDIKGNEDSMKFHTPESPWYARTNAEVWFDSAEAAQKAGFVAAVAGSDRTDDADDDATEAAALSEHVDADAALSSFAHTDSSRGRRKVRIGYVVSDKMDKTVVVAVEDRVKHKLYGKVLRQTRKLKAHDEANSAGLGDRVVVMETRPLSATKRWRLVQIVEKAR